MTGDLVYNEEAETLAKRYESRSFEEIHASVLTYLPAKSSMVLDIGAGSGRDAAWFANHGHTVVAVEPAERLMAQAKKLHPESRIKWIDDRLPELRHVQKLGLSFDVIWLSAVWMHVAPSHRERTFRKIVNLLRTGGRLMISLRYGAPPEKRTVYEVSNQEISQLAQRYGLSVLALDNANDQLQRSNVHWEVMVLQLPDDGTGGFPLLRHIIVNDDKSSTYKLALLRTLLRIAESAAGYVDIDDDGNAVLPLGLVALYWVRLYKPLIEAEMRQNPAVKTKAGLGFVKEPFHHLKNLSPYDLRTGISMPKDLSEPVKKALRDAAQTIVNMPAHYITFPNSSDPVFDATYHKIPKEKSYRLDSEFLSQYGIFKIPASIWQALSKYGIWIEPVIIEEWIALMQKYDGDNQKRYDQYRKLLQWLDPEHDTRIVRKRVDALRKQNVVVHCVWTGRKLTDNYAIDHCLPFARWPCNDLWNLMPVSNTVNLKKSDKLPSIDTMQKAHDRILEWWDYAYIGSEGLKRTFLDEARASLPYLGQNHDLETVFDAMVFQQTRIKQCQQLAEWKV